MRKREILKWRVFDHSVSPGDEKVTSTDIGSVKSVREVFEPHSVTNTLSVIFIKSCTGVLKALTFR